MAANLINLTGFVFALLVETGINVENVNHDFEKKKILVPNPGGETIGKVFYDPMAKVSIDGEVSGSNGLAAVEPGVVFTYVNILTIPSVNAGGIYTEKVSIKGNREKLRTMSIDAERHPLVA